jgi:isoaspartyl peptidase/L-asparaginase-like protein (Ntn-hydrolase superfamily)
VIGGRLAHVHTVHGEADNPQQAWTIGGLQFIHDPQFDNTEGRLAHLGIMAEDSDGAIAAAPAYGGVTRLAKGRNG